MMVWFGLARLSLMQELDVPTASLVRSVGTRIVVFVIVSVSRIGLSSSRGSMTPRLK
jgi:hypothetical protein